MKIWSIGVASKTNYYNNNIPFIGALSDIEGPFPYSIFRKAKDSPVGADPSFIVKTLKKQYKDYSFVDVIVIENNPKEIRALIIPKSSVKDGISNGDFYIVTQARDNFNGPKFMQEVREHADYLRFKLSEEFIAKKLSEMGISNTSRRIGINSGSLELLGDIFVDSIADIKKKKFPI